MSDIIAPPTEKNWGIKIESETQTLKDKNDKYTGYESSLNLNLHWMLTNQIGLITEVEGRQIQKNNSPVENTVDHSSVGLRYLIGSESQSWKLSLYHHWEDVDRTAELELRGKFKMTQNIDFKIRPQYLENLTQKQSLLRKIKIELTPRYKIADFRLGPQVKYIAKFKKLDNEYNLELNPFLEYQIDPLSIKLKQSFEPYTSVKTSDKSVAWTENSTTVLEVELTL